MRVSSFVYPVASKSLLSILINTKVLYRVVCMTSVKTAEARRRDSFYAAT